MGSAREGSRVWGITRYPLPLNRKFFKGPGYNGPRIYGLHSSWYYGHGFLTLSPGMLKPEVQNTIHSHFVFSYIFENLIISETEGCLPQKHGISSTPSTQFLPVACTLKESNCPLTTPSRASQKSSLEPLPRPACSPGSL